jgi:hypothetical protein
MKVTFTAGEAGQSDRYTLHADILQLHQQPSGELQYQERTRPTKRKVASLLN